MHALRKMSDMEIGESGLVCKIHHSGYMQKKLTDLGLTEGTFVVCELISPRGDMLAFLVRGACIALRKRDLALIDVTAE